MIIVLFIIGIPSPSRHLQRSSSSRKKDGSALDNCGGCDFACCCISTGVALRKFLIGATEVKTDVQAMMSDLRALRAVLETMEVTFEEMNSDKPVEGLIGAHWVDLFQSLGDSQQSIGKLKCSGRRKQGGQVLGHCAQTTSHQDCRRRDSCMQTRGTDIQGCITALVAYDHLVSWCETEYIDKWLTESQVEHT